MGEAVHWSPSFYERRSSKAVNTGMNLFIYYYNNESQ
jgi:hypothetical protein